MGNSVRMTIGFRISLAYDNQTIWGRVEDSHLWPKKNMLQSKSLSVLRIQLKRPWLFCYVYIYLKKICNSIIEKTLGCDSSRSLWIVFNWFPWYIVKWIKQNAGWKYSSYLLRNIERINQKVTEKKGLFSVQGRGEKWKVENGNKPTLNAYFA